MSMIDFHRKMLADHVRNTAFAEALKKIIVPEKTTIADIGSGTGVLSFLTLKLGAKHATLYETGDALELSRKLAKENGLFEKCTFVRKHSMDVRSPEKVDVVVSETLGNYALEEHTLETLQDAKRFLVPGGSILPSHLTQIVTPVIDPTPLAELRSWEKVGHSLTFNAAQEVSMNNLYVRTFKVEHLLQDSGARKTWDTINFAAKENSVRKETIIWDIASSSSISGFCLSWESELIKGVSLATHPWSPATHWEQIYLPVTKAIEVEKDDQLVLELHADSRLTTGLRIQWTVHLRRGGKVISTMRMDMQKGLLF
jgi:SAM-dependent methyltransferase